MRRTLATLALIRSPGVKGIELVRDIPGRRRRWWIQRRHDRWNLHIGPISFKTAEHPRWWLVAPGLSASWWHDDKSPLDLRIHRRQMWPRQRSKAT